MRRLYAANANFSPNTKGWIAEIAYIPFIEQLRRRDGRGSTSASDCNTPAYTEFNGTSVGASRKIIRCILYLWMAM